MTAHVTITLTREQAEQLMLALGIGAGAADAQKVSNRIFFDLVNVIGPQLSPDFRLYELPS